MSHGGQYSFTWELL